MSGNKERKIILRFNSQKPSRCYKYYVWWDVESEDEYTSNIEDVNCDECIKKLKEDGLVDSESFDGYT